MNKRRRFKAKRRRHFVRAKIYIAPYRSDAIAVYTGEDRWTSMIFREAAICVSTRAIEQELRDQDGRYLGTLRTQAEMNRIEASRT